MQLIASDLAVDRGPRRIIAGLSFVVPGGEALILTGPNGAGKTTLIRAVAGFMPLAQGVMKLEGGAPERELPEQCHYVGHANALKGSLTGAENLAFWRDYFASPAATVDDALEAFELLDLADIPAAYLSAGQKRRLGLARLLVAARPVWLLDEPTVSLDARSVTLLAAAAARHVAAGGIVVAATHLALGFEKSRELRLVPPTAEAAA